MFIRSNWKGRGKDEGKDEGEDGRNKLIREGGKEERGEGKVNLSLGWNDEVPLFTK